MFRTHLLISILLPLTLAIFFDVKRYAVGPKDGNEPYRPINYFLNKQKTRSICLFMFCWGHHGNCKSNSDCCECKCKNSSTYFSDPLGCKEGHDMTKMTKDVGKACYFATTKFGFDYVPLFHDQSRFIDIELDLPRRNFQLNEEKTVCKVGAIHDHDYHGHKLLFDRNRCSELFQVDQKHGKQYLQFHSNNVSIWNSFRGRLLSIDIDCSSQRTSHMFSSCFLFQVEGKYHEEVDGEEPPEIPAGYICPTTKNAQTNNLSLTITTFSTTTTLGSTSIQSSKTTTLRSTSSSTTLQHITVARITPRTTVQLATIRTTKLRVTTLPSTVHLRPHTTLQPATIQQTKLPTTSLPLTTFSPVTTQPNFLKIATKIIKEGSKSPKSTKVTVIFVDAKDTLTGTTIGILTGLGTGLAIVMICVIIWILIKKRKDIFRPQPVNTPIFNSETHPYDSHHGYHYDVPNVNVQPIGIIPESSLPTSSGHSSFNFTPIDDDLSSSGYSRQYSYIGEKEGMDETDFESRENAILLKSRGASKKSSDMSKRPLPDNIGYNRQYSYIGERVELDEQDFESRENTIPLKNRGGSKKSGDMSKRPLPEKPMESGNPYYSVASLTSEKSDKASEGNDLYSLYSTIDDLKGS